MINYIHIRDLVIVDQLHIDIESGMTVLTGETGAGKSILVDALGLALGDRADTRIVRKECEQAEVIVGFDLTNAPSATNWLQQQSMESTGECIIRRVINRDGRSRAYVNGRPVPILLLRELGEHLVDIHGQHAHHALLKRDQQRLLLDDYGAYKNATEAVANTFKMWKKSHDEYNHLREENANNSARSELLQYQIRELEELAPIDDEYNELETEYQRLSNMELLQQQSQQCLGLLFDADELSIHKMLSKATELLAEIQEIDPQFQEGFDLVNSALINVEEAATGIRRCSQDLEFDQERLADIEERINIMREIARKHQVQPEKLPNLLHSLTQERDQLTNTENQLDTLQTQINDLMLAYNKHASILTKKRIQAAKQLTTRVTTALQQLSMPDGTIKIDVLPNNNDNPSPLGHDTIEFLVSTNPGQKPQPLAKIVSGGELSRISLAIQVITAHNGQIPTLIFDEVDVGIGGGTAEIVGTLLRTLSKTKQILCVTHLPQVAARGKHHILIKKQNAKKGVKTIVTTLDQQGRIHEVARMLGGIELTDQTLAHAREMLNVKPRHTE